MDIWSIGTALRNPLRIPDFLRVLNNFSGDVWNEQTQLDYYIELIHQGVVRPKNISAYQLNNIQQTQARNLMRSSYEDAPMRGRVLGSLFDKLGFVDLNQGRLLLTNRGIGVINGTILFNNALIDCLTDWQYIHTISQWSNIINGLPVTQSFSPYIATLYLIGRVNFIGGSNTGITYREFIYFAKTLDNYSLVEAFSNYIVNARNNLVNETKFFRYVDSNFTNIQNVNDYIDNDIKYFFASTLILSNYVINGYNCNFANLDYNQINQIRTIVHSYIPNSLQI